MTTYTAAEVRHLIRYAALLAFSEGLQCDTIEKLRAVNGGQPVAQVLRQMEHDGLIEKESE